MPTNLVSMMLFCNLSHLDHSATRKLMSFEPKVSNIFRTLSSLASFKIRLRSTSTSSGPSRSSNAPTCTFTLRLLSRNCVVLAMMVLSLAFHPLPSSSYLPWALTKEVFEQAANSHTLSEDGKFRLRVLAELDALVHSSTDVCFAQELVRDEHSRPNSDPECDATVGNCGRPCSARHGSSTQEAQRPGRSRSR